MVDYSFQVDEEDLRELNAVKGGRRPVSSEEVLQILYYFAVIKGYQIQGAGGGSLNNTLVTLSLLREAEEKAVEGGSAWPLEDQQRDMNFVGMVCSDFYNKYYGNTPAVEHISTLEPWQHSETSFGPSSHGLTVGSKHTEESAVCRPNSGTVIVLVTEDGQRSFLSDPKYGVSDFTITRQMEQRLMRSSWLFIEGYLLEHANIEDKLTKLCDLASQFGVRVALSTGDVSIVKKSAGSFWNLLQKTRPDGTPLVNVLFANAEEAKALLHLASSSGVELQALDQGVSDVTSNTASLSKYVSAAVVTDGERGSCLAISEDRGDLECPLQLRIEAAPATRVDTCGAGDSYAAGFMHALMTLGSSMKLSVDQWQLVGNFASEMASVVVAQPGNVPQVGSSQVRALVSSFHRQLRDKGYSAPIPKNCRLLPRRIGVAANGESNASTSVAGLRHHSRLSKWNPPNNSPTDVQWQPSPAGM